jgi:hypothetical protein
MTIVSSRPGTSSPTFDWQRAALVQRDGSVVAHLCAGAEEVPRIAAAAGALAATGAFEQVVLDASGGDVDEGLRELGVLVGVRRVARAGSRLLDALRGELGRLDCVALLVYSDGTLPLAAALAATRLGGALVRVGPVDAGVASGRAVIGLADLVLVQGCEDVEALGAVAPERVHTVGNLAIDVVRRHSRDAVQRAAWRRHGVEPGRYVLAVLAGDPDEGLAAPLAELAARVPLVIEAADGAWLAPARAAGARIATAGGFVERLSLERAAGAIVTDSRRVQEEAAALGIRCHALHEPGGRVRAGAGGTTLPLGRDRWALAGVQPDANAPTPCMIPLWDGRAGTRLAQVLVANFARMRLT